MSTLEGAPVWFCTSVGGGVFGEGQTGAWRALGMDARLHYTVDVESYWRAKATFLARIKLRWAMYVSYPLGLRREVLRSDARGLFVAVTNPFFLPALAAHSGRRSGAKVIQLVYDLYPDALLFGGGYTRRNPIARIAARTTRLAISECAATVYLGERLRSYAESSYGKARHTEVIPVGTDTSVFNGHAPSAREEGLVRCLYSGNMGKLHDWKTLAGALSGGIPEQVAIQIASEGPGLASLHACLAAQSTPGRERLTFGRTTGASEWKTAMLAADVALVTMRHGAEKVVMPSKAYSAMAAGQAVLGICPRESDLADLILLHDCGWVIEPGDITGLRKKLEELPTMRNEVFRKRLNAWHAAHANYSMERIGQQWLNLFRKLNVD